MYSRVRVGRTLEYVLYPGVAYSRVCPTRVWRTLEYVLYPGVEYSRVRPTRVWRTLESMTSVAMDSRVQKFPRVRGGSYTGPRRQFLMVGAPIICRRAAEATLVCLIAVLHFHALHNFALTCC